MNKGKCLLKIALHMVYGFFTAVYTPVFICLAFNFMHGVGNNPDGEIFIPFGIAILLAILVIDILIIMKTIKSNNMTKVEKILTIALFVAAKMIGLMVDQDGWRNVFTCLKYKFME